MTGPTWRDVAFNFTDASVLVVGGTSGIGREIAAAFRAAGANVVVTGTRPNAAAYPDSPAGERYFQLDLEDPASIDAVTGAFDRLDVLVNSGGIALPSIGLDEDDPVIFARAVAMHLTGAYRLARGCRDVLAATQRGSASIINIGSMTSYFGLPMLPGYGSAKTGLLGLTRSLAVEWGPLNIRVNLIAAGLTATRMTAGSIADPERIATKLGRTPAGRLGAPADIAGAALFLASDAANWITGQDLPVDGGYTIHG